jgi:hypothetical protein
MGAAQFWTRAQGATAEQAFAAAVQEARYEHGHGGYTGTIAEKSAFVVAAVPAGISPEKYAESTSDGTLPRGLSVSIAEFTKLHNASENKWGPAVCVEIAAGSFLFFGFASE